MGVILFIFLVILIRVGWLQIVEGEKFLRLSQTARLRLIPLANPRGLIVDRNERVIADNTASFSIGVIPESLENPEKTLLKLKSIFPDIDLRKAEVKVKKVKNPFRPVVLKEGIDISKVTYIEERGEEFPSVVILSQPVRSYPYGKLLSHIVGYLGEVNKNELKNLSFLGVEAGDLVGKMGIEEVYNSYLQGEKGGRQVEVDVYGRVLKTIFQKDPLPGDTVYLTIDVNIQKIAREEMGNRKGVVIIANPYTGEILSMLSLPSFDPNLFARGISGEKWLELSRNPENPLENRAVRGEYPPASTFKIVLVTAALETGKATPFTKFYCPGYYKIGKRIFKCWKKEGHGWLNLKDALIHSCDVYFYQLGLKLGVKNIIHYARLFGLGKPTGIDLGSEKKGFLPTPEWKEKLYKEVWYPGDTANLSIGQGYILVTPIQMLDLISAVANGGYLVRPHLVKKIVDENGNTVFNFTPEKVKKIPISKSTLEFLHEALAGVVKRGTGWRANNKVVKIAGKTGTAQLAGDKNPHNWFIGYAPADNPKLSIVVLVENKKEEISIAPQIAGRILSRIFDNTEK
ncbi:penicillin-binding protein 2 [Candidatus Aerophobetes bacterium]|nr:penicillin-binding protein 2 [Candidatus Aerophobetes bacterium]